MDENLKNRINELKAEIDSLRPLDKDIEGRIQQKFRLDWNFHSNNIEGNSLTFGETKTFLLHGITADGKPLKDHLDIKGHNQALEMLEDIVRDGRDLSENFIREMHQIILHEPYEKLAITPEGKKVSRRINVGSYKTRPNHVITKTGETFYFANPEETPAMMNDLMDWFNTSITERKLHPIELAALLHYRFIRIHPFDDGNGRLSRILMNLTLMKFGFPPIIIKTQLKEEYYKALQQADGGDTVFFVNYIAKLQMDSLELYYRGATGENLEEDDDLDKEISLFKARLNKKDASIKRNIEVQKHIFHETISPLLLAIDKKSRKFNDLFHNFNYIYYDNGIEVMSWPEIRVGSIEELLSHIEGELNRHTHTEWFNITFEWDSFDKTGIERFSVRNFLNFKLTNYRYYVTYNEMIIEKTYNETLIDRESRQLISKFTQDVFNEIKRLAEEKKYK